MYWALFGVCISEIYFVLVRDSNQIPYRKGNLCIGLVLYFEYLQTACVSGDAF